MGCFSTLTPCVLTSDFFPYSDGVAYTFGEGGGLIRYSYTEGQTSNPGQVRLAFGIHTSVTDAVLLHFESQVSRDYFQLELVGRH